MEDKKIEQTKATEQVNILSLKPGNWREVAITTGLGKGTTRNVILGEGGLYSSGHTKVTDGEIIIREGSKINVLGDEDMSGYTTIKVEPKKAEGEKSESYNVELATFDLENQTIDLVAKEKSPSIERSIPQPNKTTDIINEKKKEINELMEKPANKIETEQMFLVHLTPGYWMETAEKINLGEGKTTKYTKNPESIIPYKKITEGPIVIPKGSKLNINGMDGISSNPTITIRVKPKDESKPSYDIEFPTSVALNKAFKFVVNESLPKEI